MVVLFNRNAIFINPYFLDFGVPFFSPYNRAPKGGSLDLVDTSLIFFAGNEKFYGGFSFNRLPQRYDFTVENPFTFYVGTLTHSVGFWGFSLSGFSSSIKNFSFTDLISENGVNLVIPALYYSKRLGRSDIIYFRVAFPWYKEVLVTPTDTFNSTTKFSGDFSAAYFKENTFQWQYLFIASYFLRYYNEKYSTIQNLLNYDSTKVFSRFNARLYVIYSPFQNTFLSLGPIFDSESDSYSLSAVFSAQYEVLLNLYLYFEYLYGCKWAIQRTGNFESKFFENDVKGPLLGLRFRKDFLLFVLDYSFGDRSFSSISVKFDLVR
ncbi:MAG: hypothetical protein QMD82_05970 [bacterium]|nr:hypothetical protein [bacterium]